MTNQKQTMLPPDPRVDTLGLFKNKVLRNAPVIGM